MSAKPIPFKRRMTDAELVEAAKLNLPHDTNNAVDENALIDEVMKLAPFDPTQAARVNATRIVKGQRALAAPVDGQLWLPTLDSIAWQPTRLIKDAKGSVAYWRDAGPEFIAEDARRSVENASRAAAKSSKKMAWNSEFGRWAFGKALSGAPKAEITFGRFVEETKAHKEGEAEFIEGDEE